MSAEFVDTNVLVYAHDASAGAKHAKAVDLLTRLVRDEVAAASVQVLAEFYAASTRKLRMNPEEAEEILSDLGTWTIHRPAHGDLIRASRLHRRHKLGWWDAMVVNSAIELGCPILWTEDLDHGHRYTTVTVRNPFR